MAIGVLILDRHPVRHFDEGFLARAQGHSCRTETAKQRNDMGIEYGIEGVQPTKIGNSYKFDLILVGENQP